MPFIITSPNVQQSTEPFTVLGVYNLKEDAKNAVTSLISGRNLQYQSLTIHELSSATEVYTFKRPELESLRTALLSSSTPSNDVMSNSDILRRAKKAGQTVDAHVIHHPHHPHHPRGG